MFTGLLIAQVVAGSDVERTVHHGSDRDHDLMRTCKTGSD